MNVNECEKYRHFTDFIKPIINILTGLKYQFGIRLFGYLKRKECMVSTGKDQGFLK